MRADSVTFLDEIRNRIAYDPDSGVLTWLDVSPKYFATLNAWSTWRTRFAGKTAGFLRKDGYIKITVTLRGEKRAFLAHRVAWLLEHNRWPENFIDHVNGERSDNRLCNLRSVDRQGNQRNQKRRSNNATGVLGVSWSKHANAWLARITFNGRQKNLGYYKDFNTAVAVRKHAEVLHDYHPNHGQR